MSTPPQFEWAIAEQEAEWAALSMPVAAPPAPPVLGRWRSPWPWALVGLLLFSAGGAVYALERSAQAGWEEIETELQHAVATNALSFNCQMRPI
jgi:hypothetical protein